MLSRVKLFRLTTPTWKCSCKKIDMCSHYTSHHLICTQTPIVKDSKWDTYLIRLSSRLTFSERDHDWIPHNEVAQIFSSPAAHQCNWEEWVRTSPLQQNTANGYTNSHKALLVLNVPWFILYILVNPINFNWSVVEGIFLESSSKKLFASFNQWYLASLIIYSPMSFLIKAK